MTTAHRPTFDPARGKEAQRGPAYHQRLLAAHTHLKQRQAGQGGAADSSAAPRDLRAELLHAEASVKAKRDRQQQNWRAGPEFPGDEEVAARGTKRKAIEGEAELKDEAEAEAEELVKDDDGEDEDEDPEAKRRRLILEEAHDIDADSAGGSDSDESSDDDDEEEEDETAELMRELAKIKAERAADKEREEAEQAAREAEERELEIARGNPLLNGPQDYRAKTRWNDDTIFKNQARGTDERGKRKEFVNDLLRSDFHKRFMSKYVR